jgi:hypothetical protein
MSLLPSSAYDDIRENPALVVDYYDASRDQFISALSMTGLSEEAYIAAWCTVVAYDLVPYGPGPQTTDLTTILHADTIACAHYVSLAWQLMGLFGISTENETAIGWDDGAVGNHAEMFYSDGTCSLLLDPTIGLIVNGATLEGMISGTKYTDYASFYDRDDITSFNANVIHAVSNGLYNVRDVIYDVPGLNNWLNHYSEYQGLTLDQPDGSKIIVGSLYDDTLTGTVFSDSIYGGKGDDTILAGEGTDAIEGGKGNDNIDGGDGSDTVSYLGLRSAFAISGTASTATVSGNTYGNDILSSVEYLKFSDQILPLSANWLTVANMSGAYPWDDNVTMFDGDGHRLSITYDYSDGHKYVYDYDALSQFSWQSVETTIDDVGRAPQIIYNVDDGTKSVYQYDLGDAFNWAKVQTSFDASGDRTKILYSNDDLTSVVYQYDTLDQFSWSSTARYFDTAGQKTKDVYDNDSGGHTLYEYDTAGNVTATHQYDAGWHLLA